MAKIYNSDVTKGLAKNAGIQQSFDKTPDELAEKIVPVIETNPQIVKSVDIVKSADKSVTDGAGASIFTSNSNMDFYLTGIDVHIIKDAACDTATAIKGVYCSSILGENTYLIKFGLITLTAQEFHISVDYSKPIKIDRGASIGYNSLVYTAGVALRSYCVRGYYVESRG